MATSAIKIDSGSTLSLAAHTISEDAITKYVGRSVLANSAGTELSTPDLPLVVKLVSFDTATLAKLTSVTTVVTVATITSINTLATVSTVNAITVVEKVKACVLTSGVDTIGNTKYAGVSYTPISKYIEVTSAGDGLVWTPSGGKKFVITDLTISASGSGTVYLCEGSSAYIDKLYLNRFGGMSRNLVTPFIAASADSNLIINSSASTISVWVLGYEL